MVFSLSLQALENAYGYRRQDGIGKRGRTERSAR